MVLVAHARATWRSMERNDLGPRDLAQVGLVAIAWGAAFTAGHIAVETISPYSVAALRYLLAAALLLGMLHARENLPATVAKLTPVAVRELVILALFSVVGYNVFLFAGLRYSTAVNASSSCCWLTRTESRAPRASRRSWSRSARSRLVRWLDCCASAWLSPASARATAASSCAGSSRSRTCPSTTSSPSFTATCDTLADTSELIETRDTARGDHAEELTEALAVDGLRARERRLRGG